MFNKTLLNVYYNKTIESVWTWDINKGWQENIVLYGDFVMLEVGLASNTSYRHFNKHSFFCLKTA